MTLQFFERRRRGGAACEFLGQCFSQAACQRFRGKARVCFVLGAHGDEDGMLEGRKIAALAKFQLLLK